MDYLGMHMTHAHRDSVLTSRRWRPPAELGRQAALDDCCLLA